MNGSIETHLNIALRYHCIQAPDRQRLPSFAAICRASRGLPRRLCRALRPSAEARAANLCRPLAVSPSSHGAFAIVHLLLDLHHLSFLATTPKKNIAPKRMRIISWHEH
jgi:hypothetical protein